jgi:DNA-directed RNA polymerase specialized sigma24 family protein
MDDLVRAERSHLARTLWREFPKLRDEIEDVVAEAFERVWRGAEKCDCFSPQGTYAGFRALVAKQASYLALSAARKAAVRGARAEVVSLDEPSWDGRFCDPSAEEDWERAVIGEIEAEAVMTRLTTKMGSLTDRQRIIARILLQEGEEDANAAIVDALGCSDGAAREAKRAVRERLRQLLHS